LHLRRLGVEQALTLLRARSWSPQTLGQLGMGSIGAMLSPHILLNEQGEPCNWVVKRLRSERFPDPSAVFARLCREHEEMLRYFGEAPRGLLPQTRFETLECGAQRVCQEEYVELQEYVGGVSFARYCEGRIALPYWFLRRLSLFVSSYRQMMCRRWCIPDCFSVRTEQVRVWPARRGIFIIDTNNLLDARDVFSRSPTLAQYCRPSPSDLLQWRRCYEQMCADYDYDRRSAYCSRQDFDAVEFRALDELFRWVVPEGESNPFLAELGKILQPAEPV
jgi:hypothetical protein